MSKQAACLEAEVLFAMQAPHGAMSAQMCWRAFGIVLGTLWVMQTKLGSLEVEVYFFLHGNNSKKKSSDLRKSANHEKMGMRQP